MMRSQSGERAPSLFILVGAIAGLVVSSYTNAVFAEASVSASTFFAEQIGAGGSQTGPTGAAISVSDGYHGASASASASVNTGGLPRIKLGAFATGSKNSDPEIYGNGNADATWTDNIGYDDDHLFLDFEFLGLNPFLYFVHRLHGSISNAQFMQLSLEVESSDGIHFSSDNIGVMGP
jgi:hypothetical protein